MENNDVATSEVLNSEAEVEPTENGEKRLQDPETGRFVVGNPGGPGRPKGISIKDRVRNYLEAHPDEMEAFIKHFAKDSRELAWQMLEGRPSQNLDHTSGGEPLPILGHVPKNDSDGKNNPAE